MAKRTIDPNKLPGNSRDPVLKAAPKIQPVATGRTTKKGVSLSSTLRTVVNDLFFSVIVPQFWNTITDFGIRTLQEIIPGQNKRSFISGANRPITAYTPYNTLYQGVGNAVKAIASPQTTTERAGSGIVDTGFHEIYFDSEDHARLVLAAMIERLAIYKRVSLGDMRHLANLPTNMSHQKYYWTDLTGSYIELTEHGFTIVLPDFLYSK